METLALSGLHGGKSLLIWSFAGPYFPAFGLNTDRKISQYKHISHGVDHVNNVVVSFRVIYIGFRCCIVTVCG